MCRITMILRLPQVAGSQKKHNEILGCFAFNGKKLIIFFPGDIQVIMLEIRYSCLNL